MGLEIGADDYVVKPFSAPEVMARVKAVLRRVLPRGTAEAGTLAKGNLLLREEARQAEVAGQKLSLTHKEFDLLATFLAHPERVYSRDNLLDLLWGYDYTGDTRTVDTHIRRLRAKLEKAGTKGLAIGTVWGEGYRLEDNP
jgi:two-component system response regulator ResD